MLQIVFQKPKEKGRLWCSQTAIEGGRRREIGTAEAGGLRGQAGFGLFDRNVHLANVNLDTDEPHLFFSPAMQMPVLLSEIVSFISGVISPLGLQHAGGRRLVPPRLVPPRLVPPRLVPPRLVSASLVVRHSVLRLAVFPRSVLRRIYERRR